MTNENELMEAKEAVAFKYFREKWATLTSSEKVRHMDEVAELYADSKVKNLTITPMLADSLPCEPLLFDNTRLRQVVIGQSGYGMSGCKLCGSEWMRRPNTEKIKHKKTCLAYPSHQSATKE